MASVIEQFRRAFLEKCWCSTRPTAAIIGEELAEALYEEMRANGYTTKNMGDFLLDIEAGRVFLLDVKLEPGWRPDASMGRSMGRNEKALKFV